MEVADLGDQPDRGQGVDAAQAAQPPDRRCPRLEFGLLADQRVETVPTREQHLVAGQVLTEHGVGQRLVEADSSQPGEMALRPRVPRPGENQAAAQRQLADPVSGAHQVTTEVLAGTHEIAQCLKLGLRHYHRPQLPGRVQPRELQRVTHVGLDPVSGLTPGEQTITSMPAARAALASPNPVGPAS